ncbi:MAG: HRDC domain-containing protein [Cystobacterineae bacterium]|nr:HRDC domain-containing protein [Cystobacterineae bacterium]
MLSPNLCRLVHTQTELEHVLSKLNTAKELAVDTESDNLYAFRARLCLIQIATDEEIFLVDALSEHLDPQILAPVFENPQITKYFHSASGDLSFLLTKQLHVLGLFDTQRAAAYLKKPKLGLAWLTENYLGISLDKAQQRANFAKRPFSDEVLHYAASDVRFLLQLGRLLKAECLQKNSLEEVLLDCLRLENEAREPANPGERFVFYPPSHLSIAQQHLANKIAHFLNAARLRWAKRKKKPFGQVLSNQSLYAIAYAAPTSLEELQEIPGIRRDFIARFGAWVLKQIEEIKQTELDASDEATLPYKRDIALPVQRRIDALRKFRTQELSTCPLAPQQILTNTLIERLAEYPPDTPEELLRFPYFGNKRFRLYGSRLLDLLNNPEPNPPCAPP